jgi:hypothetical protein
MFHETVNVVPNIIVRRSEKKPVLFGLTGRLQVRAEMSGMFIAKKLQRSHEDLTPYYFLAINYLCTTKVINSDFSDEFTAELEDSHSDIFGKTIQSSVS